MSTPANYLSSLMTATSNALKSIQEPFIQSSSEPPPNVNTAEIKLTPTHSTSFSFDTHSKSPRPLHAKLVDDPKLLEHYRNIYLNPKSK